MGTCNVDIVDHENPDGNLAMSHNLPSGEKDGRIYDWYKKSEVDGQSIIEVPWAGTPFAIIDRPTMEKITLEGDKRYNPGMEYSHAYDVQIAHDLKALGIPLRVDTGVYFWHNRLNDRRRHLLNGKLPRQHWIDKGRKRQIIITEPIEELARFE